MKNRQISKCAHEQKNTEKITIFERRESQNVAAGLESHRIKYRSFIKCVQGNMFGSIAISTRLCLFRPDCENFRMHRSRAYTNIDELNKDFHRICARL